MSRSRRSNASARRQAPESRVPAWVWIFTGCVLGAFIMFLFTLAGMKPESTKSAQTNKQASHNKAVEPKPTAPRFDFYDVLKKNKVTVPDNTGHTTTKTPSGKSATPDLEYILQVASFKSMDDAEQLKVELLLLNLEAFVEQAQLRNGETWYRVLVGPIESRSRREKIRTTLVANHYEALVLKRAKSASN